MTLADPNELVASFSIAASLADVPGWPVDVGIEYLPAPHKQPRLRPGHGAVYAFAIGAQLGARAPAGAGTVLKVGKVGPNSGARFEYHHYGSGARSTLAQSLLRHRVLWPWLGISALGADRLSPSIISSWMTLYLDRVHFFVPAGHLDVLRSLEIYVRGRVGSVFEGAG